MKSFSEPPEALLGPPSSNKNCWDSYRKYPYVTWVANFPRRYVEPREYLGFLQEVLALAEQEEVFRAVRAPLNQGARQRYPEKYWEYRAQPGGPTYSQFMEQAFEETGRIIFSSQLDTFPGLIEQYLVRAATRLSYYNPDGQLMESDVDNIGALQRQVRPAEDEVPDDWSEEERRSKIEKINKWRKDGPAIYLHGGPGSNLATWEEFAAWQSLPEAVRDPEEEPASPSVAGLNIELYTDIWLPQVLGTYEDMSLACKQAGVTLTWIRNIPLFDNRELAFRHTPRLNRFLQGVRQLVEQRGGSWQYEDGDAPEFYEPMLSKDGINLDI